MADLIDRKMAIEIIQNMYPGMPRTPWMRKDWQKRYEPYIRTENAIKELPSAPPEWKEGRWIDLDSDTEKYDDVMCSNCKQIFMVDAHRWCDIGFTVDDLKFCPNCGAYMKPDNAPLPDDDSIYG